MVYLVIALTLVLPGQQKDAVEKEHEKLNGTWRLISAEGNGQKMPDEQVKQFLLTFHSGHFTSSRSGDKRTGTYKVDPSTNPKTMEIVPADGPDKGKTWSLIYSLEGDTLRICGSKIGDPRPTDFDTKGKKEVILMVLRHS